jgi:hypothetical protein
MLDESSPETLTVFSAISLLQMRRGECKRGRGLESAIPSMEQTEASVMTKSSETNRYVRH